MGGPISGTSTAAATARAHPTYVLVSRKSDLPSPIAGVITLANNTTYLFTTVVDLNGDRLVAGQNTTIRGGSSENCRIKSTGLIGNALITSQWSLSMLNVAVESAIAFDLDAAGNAGESINWFGVHLTDCAVCGTIANYYSVSLTDCALLNSGALTFDGTINAVGFSQCLFTPRAGASAVTIAATATIALRFRIIYSDFEVQATSVGLTVSALVSLPVAESFVLDMVTFAGLGIKLSGISQSDSSALISGCIGVANSAAIAEYYMNSNVVATNLPVQGAFYKLEGATLPGPVGSQFSLSNNRATFVGARSGPFLAQAVAVITDGNNQDVALRFAVNGVTIPASEARTNTGASGRAHNVSAQCVLNLSTGNYVELWAANLSSGNSTMTAIDLNVIVSRFQ